MINTKIKKIVAAAALATMLATTINGASATDIGTGTVTGNSALDQTIVWDDTFGIAGNAEAIVTGIKVTATVAPTMNVSFSADEIALGLLTPGQESTGTLNIEVWTNASAGTLITLRSANGWLKHTQNWELINSDENDDESYRFEGTAVLDTVTVTGITKTGLSNVDVNTDNITTEHQLYLSNKAEIAENNDDIVLTVGAKAIATTSAWDYDDTLTFTITGNF